MSDIPDFETLAEAKEYLRENWEKGCLCPNCGQLVKKYKRKFNSGMARVLIAIYRIDKTKPADDKWIMISKEVLATGINPTNLEYSKLKHWGLTEERGDIGEHTPTAGYWRITDRGRKFVEGSVKIPSHIYVYNDKFLEATEEGVSISEALGKHFDYDELMGHTVS